MDLVGTWRLKSAYFVAQGTGDRLDWLGAEPFGYAVFEPRGRLIVIITSSARTRAASATHMAALHKSMVALHGQVVDRRREAHHAGGRCMGPELGRDRTSPALRM